MFKVNSTGLPDTGDYVLGRGKLYLGVIDTATGRVNSDGFRHIGNVPGFNLTVEEETLDHRSSQEGLATIDKSVTLSKKASISSLQFDEINAQNVALFFGGTMDTYVNPAVAGFAEINQWIDGVKLGAYYQLTNAADGAGDYVMGVTPANVVLEKDAAMDVALVENTDYTLDPVTGLVFFKTTAVNIANGNDVNLTLTADAGAPATIARIKALQQTSQAVILKFVAENPADNDGVAMIECHQVTLKADGDFALIGDEFTAPTLTGVLEANNLGYPTSPYMTVYTHSEM